MSEDFADAGWYELTGDDENQPFAMCIMAAGLFYNPDEHFVVVEFQEDDGRVRCRVVEDVLQQKVQPSDYALVVLPLSDLVVADHGETADEEVAAPDDAEREALVPPSEVGELTPEDEREIPAL